MQLKKIITFVLALAVLVPVFPLLADDDDNATSSERRAEGAEMRDERRASSTEQREERFEDREERQASNTERRVEIQKELAKRKAENTARVLTATVERLERIITRLESRIEKVEDASGTPATDAREFVADARDYLALATTSIAEFEGLTFTADKARENFEEVRNLASEVKGYIREAHRSLMNAIRSLKGSPESES